MVLARGAVIEASATSKNNMYKPAHVHSNSLDSNIQYFDIQRLNLNIFFIYAPMTGR
jgi:hypothetical protein